MKNLVKYIDLESLYLNTVNSFCKHVSAQHMQQTHLWDWLASVATVGLTPSAFFGPPPKPVAHPTIYTCYHGYMTYHMLGREHWRIVHYIPSQA